jgi:hypothetical protein
VVLVILAVVLCQFDGIPFDVIHDADLGAARGDYIHPLADVRGTASASLVGIALPHRSIAGLVTAILSVRLAGHDCSPFERAGDSFL